MVRTKGDGAVTKAVGSKAPRKQLVANGGASSSSSNPDSAKKKAPSCGLPYCPQPTPEWQKSIKSFFKVTSRPADEDQPKAASPSDDDKENKRDERMDDAEVEVVEKTSGKKARNKGKGLASGKSRAKKSSKKSTEDEPVPADDSHKDDSADEEEPVKRRRNAIESDDDD